MSTRQKFVEFQITYIEVVLESAVSRACSADDAISKDVSLQQSLIQLTLGLCVIYHMAFIQKELGEVWSTIKGFNSGKREDYNLDWILFDILKYIRDCFAHDPSGGLFPPKQANTKRFIDNLPNYPFLKVQIIDNRIIMSNSTVQQSFNYFENLIQETIT